MRKAILSKALGACRAKKRLLIAVLCVLIAIPTVLMPLTAVIVYESIFARRYEPLSWMTFEVADFEGLEATRTTFVNAQGTELVGYCYTRAELAPCGVVVIAHGMGGGGQNAYLPFADAFTKQGFAVFAYDATGNGESPGRAVRGLPQGVADLDAALAHVKALPQYKELPLLLFGHSWGAYAAGSVLAWHPDVRAAVLVSGFDRSRDMLLYQSSTYVGFLAEPTLPYVTAYERLKFGTYATASVTKGIQSSQAHVLVVHGRDDVTVPPTYGYDRYYEAFSNEERVAFLAYDGRGHDDLLYSQASGAYRAQLNAAYAAHVQANGGTSNAAIKEAFMEEHLDLVQCFEPDPALLAEIVATYRAAVGA